MLSMLVAALALWDGQALAQATQPSQTSQSSPPSQSSQSSQSSQPSQPSPSSQASYSADGLYNLANSYARAGKPGLAVLSYERAALLAPDDPDINANLQYVLAVAHVPVAPRNRFARLVPLLNPTLPAWLFVAGVALVGMGLVATRLASRFLGLAGWMAGGGIPVGAILVGIALIALTACNALLLWPRLHQAVVLIDQTPARVSPVPMGDTAFVLREAESVMMMAEHEDFIFIRTGGGLSGWVSRANLGAVVPPPGND
jgi:hypothetical protein